MSSRRKRNGMQTRKYARGATVFQNSSRGHSSIKFEDLEDLDQDLILSTSSL